MAAVLHAEPACAAGAGAAYLHDLPGFDQPEVEILTWNHTTMPHSGVKVHKTNRLPADQVTTVRGIPTTSVERTLLDISGLVSRRRAAIALDHALHLGLTTVGACDYCLFLTARRGRRGVATFRALVHSRAEVANYPNSPLETVIFDLIRMSRLPLPSLQLEIRDGERLIARPDFVYPEWQVAIEGHSRLWHSGPEQATHDLMRHERVVGLGYDVLYVTWADATTYGEATLAQIERALLAKGWTPDHETRRAKSCGVRKVRRG